MKEWEECFWNGTEMSCCLSAAVVGGKTSHNSAGLFIITYQKLVD